MGAFHRMNVCRRGSPVGTSARSLWGLARLCGQPPLFAHICTPETLSPLDLPDSQQGTDAARGRELTRSLRGLPAALSRSLASGRRRSSFWKPAGGQMCLRTVRVHRRPARVTAAVLWLLRQVSWGHGPAVAKCKYARVHLRAWQPRLGGRVGREETRVEISCVTNRLLARSLP